MKPETLSESLKNFLIAGEMVWPLVYVNLDDWAKITVHILLDGNWSSLMIEPIFLVLNQLLSGINIPKSLLWFQREKWKLSDSK